MKRFLIVALLVVIAVLATFVASPRAISQGDIETFLQTHNFLSIPTSGEGDSANYWERAWGKEIVGSGKVYPRLAGVLIGTGFVPNSSAVWYTGIWGFNSGSPNPNIFYFNFDHHHHWIFNFAQESTVPSAEGWLKLQSNTFNATGELIDKGIGLRVVYGHLYGISYGTQYGEIDLNYEFYSVRDVRVEIRHNPAQSIEWYLDGNLAGTQTDLTKIPSGTGSDFTYLVFAVEKGEDTTTDWFLYLAQPIIWGDR